MIRTDVNLKPLIPCTREHAAKIANIAGRFESRLNLECEAIVLNMKSMLGLLSQARLPAGRTVLVASGEDEEAATKALVDVIAELTCE